jgi:bacillithiol system protein YtxJ
MRFGLLTLLFFSIFSMAFVLRENSEKKNVNWINLIDPAQVESILVTSQNKPALIFKHSTRCSISAKALADFEKDWKMSYEACDLYFVDLLAFRPVSNKVAERIGVAHQSPQVIVIHKGQAVYSRSHQAISAKEIRKFILKLDK